MIYKIEQTALRHFKYLPERVGFPIIQNEEMTLINCGLGSSMFNIVFGAPGDSGQQVLSVIDEFRDQPFAWWIPPTQHSDKLSEHLTQKGFVVEAAEHAMICDLAAVELEQPKTKLRVEEVSSSAQMNDFVSILEPYDPTARQFYERVQLPLVESAEKLFVGYIEGKPVAIGILCTHKDTAGIFSLLTDEGQRGQGLGTAMMLHLMSTAKQNGACYASLSASSDSGFRIYERLGFKTLGQFDCFEWKGN
jgi:ribosomal protein S18 acetylase RimI-like enzyme